MFCLNKVMAGYIAPDLAFGSGLGVFVCLKWGRELPILNLHA